MDERTAAYWRARAEDYSNLGWAKDSLYIKRVLAAAEIERGHTVLDVGAGTGIMADAACSLASVVVALDPSAKMLERGTRQPNKINVEGDIRDTFFSSELFDRVIARSVFHHIAEDTQRAMDECRRLLKPGGRMVLAQGVPPSNDILNEYRKIFSLKDGRIVQTVVDLLKLMSRAGFVNIEKSFYELPCFSVRNWLENNALPPETQARIFAMHVNASDKFKRAFKMTVLNGDCYIAVKNIILTGEK